MTKSLIQRFQFSRVAVLCFLMVLVITAAIPSYWKGYWPWAQPLPVANLNNLKILRKTGVRLPRWQIKKQQAEIIGGHPWTYQELQQDDQKPVKLLLLPQRSDKDQPEVEWMDINGFEGWRTDSEHDLHFTVQALKGKEAKVKARFFRAWNQRQTFAVLQWYALPDGGHPDPSYWFFADQLAQWRRQRIPWIAVSLHIPIQPLGDVETARTSAESLGKTVQEALMPNLNH